MSRSEQRDGGENEDEVEVEDEDGDEGEKRRKGKYQRGLDAKNAKAENRVAIPAYTGVLACPSFLPPGRVIGN